MRAKEFIKELRPEFGDPKRFVEPEPEEPMDIIVKDMLAKGYSLEQAEEEALDWLIANNKHMKPKAAVRMVKECITRIKETSASNAEALVGSGKADPHGKKTNPDSKEHKKVRTPGTTYAKNISANPGFVGG